MIDDSKNDLPDLPDYLKISEEDRAKAWEDNPPKPFIAPAITTRDDPAVAQIKADIQNRVELKKAARFAKLKAKTADQTYRPGMRWCPKRCAFITDSPSKKERKTMSELENNTETKVPTPKKKKTNGAKKTAKKKVAAKPKKPKKEGPSKTAIVARLLQRQNGCTSAEVLEATNWPAVSMPAIAKAAKLKLRKEKEPGKPTRYYGS